MNFFKNYLNNLSEKINEINHEDLVKIYEIILESHKKNGKIIVIGNGGSAAISSHVSVDMTKAAKIRAINFNESDLITCFANDYGYEKWVEEALKFYADKHDVAILISSSGESKNIINGAIAAKKIGLKVVTLSGFNANNTLKKLGDINIHVESSEYNIIENCHQVWLLALVDYIINNSR